MDSMAAVATSAALPWMGVLMAALNACPCVKSIYQPYRKLTDNYTPQYSALEDWPQAHALGGIRATSVLQPKQGRAGAMHIRGSSCTRRSCCHSR